MSQAVEEYLAHRARRGSKGIRADTYAAKARIIPALGGVEVAKLTTKRIRDWHESVAAAARMVRTKRFANKQATREFDADRRRGGPRTPLNGKPSIDPPQGRAQPCLP